MQPWQLRARRLAVGFGVLVAAAFSLIVLGALVRAHGAGLACPDWPLCFGQLVPSMNLKIGFEWSHRALAGSVSLGFLALAFGVLREPHTRRAAGAALGMAAILLATQIVLGALTVWRLLADWTVTSHLLVGNALCATWLWIALALGDAGAPGRERARPAGSLRFWVGLPALLMLAQLTLGGLVASRYAGLACPAWPSCDGVSWFPEWSGARGLHLLHRMNGYALAAALGIAVWTIHGSGRLAQLTRLAFGLTLLQLVVCVANGLLRLPVEITGLHSALAAALVLALVAMQREAWS